MTLETFYGFVAHLGLISWLALLIYCSPGLWRVAANAQLLRGDLLAVLLASVSFIFAGYRLLGLMFGTALGYGQAELVARSALGLLSILCSVMCFRVHYQYRDR